MPTASHLASLLREHFDEVIDDGIRLTRGIPQYAAIDPVKLRPSVVAGFSSVLADLEAPPYARFCKTFGEISYRRARQGFEVSDLYGVIDLTEQILGALSHQHIADPAARLPAIEQSHSVCGTARTAIMESFRRANQEFLAEANAIIMQLSAPLLPLYPGILALPIVGDVNAARIERIQEAFLSGIVSNRAKVALLDITGMSNLNRQTAQYLVRLTGAARLLGARVVVTGVGPEAAKVLQGMELDVASVSSLRTLEAGLEQAFRERGLEIVQRRR